MLIRNSDIRDLESITALHIENFSGFMMNTFGRAYAIALYSEFVNGKDSFCLVAEHDGEIVGFTAISLNPTSFFGEVVRKNWSKFIWKSIKVVFKNPVVNVRKVLSLVQYRGERPENISDAVLISAIVVKSDFRGRGIATELLNESFKEIRLKGFKHVYLMTSFEDNLHNLYASVGFNRESSHRTRDGNLVNRYLKQL